MLLLLNEHGDPSFATAGEKLKETQNVRRQSEVSFSWVSPVIDYRLVNPQLLGNLMTKFMINNRPNEWKTEFSL